MDIQNHIKGFSVALFENQVANGESLLFEHMHDSKSLNVYVTGNLGGGIIIFQALAPNGEWVPVAGDPIDVVGLYDISGFPFVGRAVLSGSSAASVSVIVQGFVREIAN